MAEMRIEKETWKIIELVIRRYPDKKREYEQYISEIMASSAAAGVIKSELEEYSKPQSVTEAKAMKMTSVYADRLKKQIEAVEFVYNNLRPEEQKLMRIRFWTDRRRNIPYLKIKDVSYSERQMKRIVYRIIVQIGKYLGEIK
ncbi:MAG: hypothetical protein J6C19_05780 [Lachnospiraceae bacterium]|nr:hypothetical protein [Lachnospiraceae bacterium]